MTARLSSILSALVVGVGMVAAPNFAQAETFQAWGHEFTVPGSSSPTPSVAAPTSYTSMSADIVGHSARHTGTGGHASKVVHGAIQR